MKILPNLQKGFSLIELMVVVAIIGVLMTAGLVAFSGAQKNARDSKRRTDMDAISKAMEQFYLANASVYPTTVQGTAVLATYFQVGAYPTDPQSPTANYTTTLNATGTTFCVCALLENTGRGNSINNACNYTGAGSKNYMCTSQRQ